MQHVAYVLCSYIYVVWETEYVYIRIYVYLIHSYVAS